MHPIIHGLPDRLSADVYQKKCLLNAEFRNTSKIQGFVSYFYYPSQKMFPLLGHVKLGLGENSYSWMTSQGLKIKPLTRMIKSSESGRGFPFFRFQISVTPNQLRDLEENIFTAWGSKQHCSMGVATVLSGQAKYTIPLPFAFSPLTSAVYLAGAKMLGSQRITQIDFHGGRNPLKNFAKSITGVAFECFCICAPLILIYAVFSKIVNSPDIPPSSAYLDHYNFSFICPVEGAGIFG